MVALASAFVRLRPQVDRSEFRKAGEQAGTDAGAGAGKTYGEGFKRGSDGKLRDAHGKFVKDSEAAGAAAGGKAGAGFGGGFSKGTSKAFGALKSNLSLAAGVFVPLGLAGAVGEIGKIGIAYENNLNIFKVVSKATAKEMSAVSEKARQLGADVTLPGVSAAGAAEAMTELAKAGFTVQQSMDAARATLQLARVANISEADAAEIAANAVNAFGIQAKDTGFVVDELAAAANSSSIEISDASLAFKQAAAVFSGMQGEAVGSKEAITELNTAIAILGNNGIKGSDAGTSLKQALLQLTGPSNQAKDIMKELAYNAAQANIPLDLQNQILHGGKKEREAAIAQIEKLNPSIKNVGDIAYDSAGKMRPLRDIIKLTTEGTKGMTQEERNFAVTQIFGADASRSILALMKGGLPVYDAQRKAILQQGAAAQFAAAKNAGLGGAIDNVKSQFENAAISIYNVVKGPLTKSLNTFASTLPTIFEDIAKFSGFISRNIDVLRDWAVAIAAVTLALKINSAMLAVQAAGGVIQFIKGISIVTKATTAWSAAQELLNITLIANPIGAVIVAVTALVAGIILLYRHNETFRKIVQAVWAAIKTAIKATVDWIVGTAWPAIKAAFSAIGDVAVWLWHHVFEPVWHGIQAVVGVVVKGVKFYIEALVTEFKIIAAVAQWLWHNIFGPVFSALKKIVEIWWLAVQVIFKAFYNAVRGSIVAGLNILKAVFSAVFNYVRDNVVKPWWTIIRTIFNAFRTYVVGPFVAGLNVLRAAFARIFTAIAAIITSWWRSHITPVFNAVKNAFTTLAVGFYTVYNTRIKPLFTAFVSFIRNTVVGGFKAGVSAIASAWDKVRDAARKPVAFVVNHVINPFINGLNTAAKIVGVKDRVAPIKGFAAGGKISGTGGMTDNRQAVIPGVGAVQLMGGEYVVNRAMTAQALPLLRWINDGMKGGADKAGSYIGRPLTQYPGDGSEGWAFKGGGLVGWTKDIWSAISNPAATIKKPFEAALAQVPGSGMIRGFLLGAARKLLNGAIGWLTGAGGGVSGSISNTINAVKARAFVQQQAGKPYVWASAGPGGYDCSGIVSAAYNILKGRSPYHHTFSTGSLPGPWFDTGRKIGTLMAGWSHPGQSPASASVGHMAGQIAGMPFESTGSSGVRIGNRARRTTQFANTGVARAKGGLIGEPIRLFDNGGYWPSGTLGANLSGRTEFVQPRTGGRSEGVAFHFHRGSFEGAIMTNSSQAEDLVVAAVKSAQRKRKLP